MTMSKKKPIKLISAFIALSLVFAMLFADYGSVFGEVAAYGSKYISEVQIFQGNSYENALKYCEEAGYTPVKKNINRAASGDVNDNGIYVVGYKTTENQDEGITGISMLQMNSGYQDYTYGDIAERAVEKLGTVPSELSYAVDEFIANYEKGSPAAQVAVDILNCFFVDELDNKKLGDYLISGNCNLDFVKKILSRSSTTVMSAFCNALVAGVADYDTDNWAQRLEKSEVIEQVKSGDNNKALDAQYKSLATELIDSVQSFASGFNEAKERYKENNNKIPDVDSDVKKKTEMSEETAEDVTNGGEVKTEDGDAGYLTAYNILNKYNYDETTKLGDYIVALGNSTYDDIEMLRKMYPLVDCLTDGQLGTMRLSGVVFSTIYLVNESSLLDEAKTQMDAIRKKLKEACGSECVSIWTGTDQTVYNEKVAVTKDAYRANSAGQIYNTLTAPDDVEEILSSALYMINIASAVIGLGYCLTSLATVGIAYYITGQFMVLNVWAVCCGLIGPGVISSIFGIIGCAFVILNYVALIALVVIYVALLIKYLWDKFTVDDAEDFTPIPSVIYDEAQNRYVKYSVVNVKPKPYTVTNERSGERRVYYPPLEPGNINGSNARRWNALYTTKSKYVGDPICSSEIDDLITVQYNNNSTPQGYKPVKCFGEVEAANLNANSRSDSMSIYMYCKSTTNTINEGEETESDATTATTYISKLSLSVEETETAAKAALTKSGYKVLDTNLTPVTADMKKYTYIGYATTTNPNDAVTDIRIAARNSTDAFLYGNASYTSCGTTVTGDTLYYTSYKSAGSPILAGLLLKNTLTNVPEGYEPINLFSGGNAFNFNVGSEVDNTVSRTHSSQTSEHWGDKGMYLYFKPSVSYTDGEEYISGIVLVAGNKSGYDNKNTADDYIETMNLKKFDLSLTQNAKVQLPNEVAGMVSKERWASNIETYICYTTTHNPYRAIYGIRSYTAAPGNTSVPVALGTLADGAYSVCDVYFELPYLISGSSYKKNYLRGIYDSHSYLFAGCSGTNTGIEQEFKAVALEPEDYEDVSWSSCSSARGKGIYVLGPVEGGTPLTVSDVQVSSSSEIPSGFISVQDFKTPNRTEVHNLGYTATNSKFVSSGKNTTPVYIYTRQEAPVEKKYISSISVSTYSLETAAGDNLKNYDTATRNQLNASGNDYCMQSLLSQCSDEIIQSNIALDKSQTFYGNASATPNTASYIGVSRTDSSLDAITGIIRYVTDKKDVSATIKVNGATYTKAGDMIYDPNGSYYLYYTNSGGANPGEPLTSIHISTEVFDNENATALSANSVDVSEIKVGDEVKREASTAKLYGDVKCTNFIHMAYEDNSTMMGAIYVGHGKTKKEAQANLLELGCNICVDMDVNRNTGGEYIYIGYTRYELSYSEKRKGVAKNAVRDIVLTVGQPHQKEIYINGIKYKNAVDEYTIVKGHDGSRGVSLNLGTGGKQIYLYYSTEITKDTQYTIAKLGLACMDYGMVNNDSNKWEHVYDADGNRVNLNEGAIYTIDDGNHIADNRVYLYASRTDNQVKESAAVDMRSINNEFIAYDVYMEGA